MAKQENNIVMKNARGMFGDQVVFKLRAGETILAAPPIVNTERVITAEEEAVREKFRQTVRFAKAAIKDPAKKEAYLAMAKRGQTAFNVAFSDFYFAPEILEINPDFYNGVVGDIITITAVDNIKVVSVNVRIIGAGDNLIEQGNAADALDGMTWKYAATVANANMAGVKIVATATDIAGNATILEFVM
ncbi:MAG: hypothetical protein J7497_10815 [Chitinophagaceae bacterium]|nr:hypothetical protein [Chitinophagaceae bacterium]